MTYTLKYLGLSNDQDIGLGVVVQFLQEHYVLLCLNSQHNVDEKLSQSGQIKLRFKRLKPGLLLLKCPYFLMQVFLEFVSDLNY